MVLTKSDLIGCLQNEVRILLHLASKIDRTKLDYRPTPKQRSTAELLKYLTVMGPALVQAGLTELLAEYKSKPEEAKKLIAYGESKADPAVDAATQLLVSGAPVLATCTRTAEAASLPGAVPS